MFLQARLEPVPLNIRLSSQKLRLGVTRHRPSSPPKTEFLVSPPDPALPAGHLIGDGGDCTVPLVQVVTESEVRLLTSRKSVKRPDGWKGKCFTVDADSQGWGGGPCPKADSLPAPHLQARAFIDGGRGSRTETAQAADGHLGTGHRGLASIVSIKHSPSSVPGSVPTSMRPVLEIIAAYVTAIAQSS